MKKSLLLLLVYFCSVQWLFAQKQVKEFDRLMSEIYKEDGSGGVALVVKDGETLYRKAFGMANLELDIKMTPDHVFRIGSITKQFTAAAILKLRDEGKLDLDDDISKYIEGYPMHGHHISIKHLLTHTSGIKSYTSMEEWTQEIRKKDFSREEFVEFFKFQPMLFAPGERWSYSNSGYFLLGLIIEKVSGMTYKEYIDQNIFTPLGMSHSYYNSNSKIIKNRAYGYERVNDEYLNTEFLSMTQPYAAGALISTVDDLYKWYYAVMHDQVISKSSREEAHTTFLLNNGEKTGYGYGWEVGNIQGVPSIHHGGGINGFLTASIYLPTEDLFVTVFSNCMCNPPGNISVRMAAIALGEPFEREPIKFDEQLMNSYVAVYENDKGDQRVITYEDGQLYSQITGGLLYKIWPYEKDKFFFESTTTLQFNRGSNDEIVSATSKSTGYDVVWSRTEKPIPTIEAIELDDSVAVRYLGKYAFSPNFHITIFKEDQKMFAQASGQPKMEIVPIEENQFAFTKVDAKVTFNTDENGEVNSLILHQGGDHEAKKVE